MLAKNAACWTIQIAPRLQTYPPVALGKHHCFTPKVIVRFGIHCIPVIRSLFSGLVVALGSFSWLPGADLLLEDGIPVLLKGNYSHIRLDAFWVIQQTTRKRLCCALSLFSAIYFWRHDDIYIYMQYAVSSCNPTTPEYKHTTWWDGRLRHFRSPPHHLLTRTRRGIINEVFAWPNAPNIFFVYLLSDPLG